ncbi:MAG: carbon-nitrogen family hydrolase [Verrucomicrobia bacterium]|nr:carbon-nitrogen family hydrolase [Verrucomicrobiota bacterium]
MRETKENRVVCAQLDLVWEDKPANFDKARALLDGVEPGSLVLLPEMFPTGFSMNVAAIGEGIPSESERFLSELARERGICLVAGLVTPADDGRGRNEAVVFDPEGKLLGRYCKLHPFTFGGESEHYQRGSEIVTFPWAGFVVAPFICYDLRFPEAFRAAVRRGATLFVVIANWPSRRVNHWVTLLRARAIENQAYVVAVNRCGSDPKLEYPGRSLVIDPQGEILQDAGDSEGCISAAMDPEVVASWRAQFPALQDIRQEFLGGDPSARTIPS